jgi:hypothetical protein
MHQTTVRFGSDLWSELVREAERAGVSVAQYVREAAVARLARGGAFADTRAGNGTALLRGDEPAGPRDRA